MRFEKGRAVHHICMNISDRGKGEHLIIKRKRFLPFVREDGLAFALLGLSIFKVWVKHALFFIEVTNRCIITGVSWVVVLIHIL